MRTVIAHGSGIDDLLIPLVTVGAVAYYAFRPRSRRGGEQRPTGAPAECAYCGAGAETGAKRCTECGFRR